MEIYTTYLLQQLNLHREPVLICRVHQNSLNQTFFFLEFQQRRIIQQLKRVLRLPLLVIISPGSLPATESRLIAAFEIVEFHGCGVFQKTAENRKNKNQVKTEPGWFHGAVDGHR
jgi:hypothetical protein